MRLSCAVAPVRFLKRLLLGITAAAGILPCANAQQPPRTATLAEQYLLAAANQERASRGLGLLHRDPLLARAAAQHAGVMAAHGSISHQFPGEPELTDRGARAGVAFSAISENVAEAPSVIQIHDMWMNSEHHRANLLDPAIDSAGISVVTRGRHCLAGCAAGPDHRGKRLRLNLHRSRNLRDGHRLRRLAQALVRDAL